MEQNKDYNNASEIYEVSYQQVYQWVKKYEESGENGLVDRRGKIELTSKDKDQIEMRKLKKDNERLRMENDFLKKLQELERGGF
ncbi:helix-turn-helix domain-containing protein [Tissierella sp. MB52-C2]|uniref:helix-turn-helix domain-containing protein n=1 Tax=Tissierella sp. MB52-C2 TaxID=3070999 RepID=UPI00280C28CC|nr:helix-turn-helix domain-containing protein [Tissierella sp. MB52-C2]WMM26951.1 helix-turn-helix domain-containing protein [Tissierella sp. MB52-C2]